MIFLWKFKKTENLYTRLEFTKTTKHFCFPNWTFIPLTYGMLQIVRSLSQNSVAPHWNLPTGTYLMLASRRQLIAYDADQFRLQTDQLYSLRAPFSGWRYSCYWWQLLPRPYQRLIGTYTADDGKKLLASGINNNSNCCPEAPLAHAVMMTSRVVNWTPPTA